MQGMAEEEVTDEETTGIGRQASAGGLWGGGIVGKGGGVSATRANVNRKYPAAPS